jgi:hypothetical protein
MLKDFMISTPPRVSQTERADGPAVMITPNNKKYAGDNQG